MVYLKPVVPGLAERAEAFLNVEPLLWSDAGTPLLKHRLRKFRSLLERVPPEEVQAMMEKTRSNPAAPQAGGAEEIDIELFSKVDLRIARVAEADLVDGADRLLRLRLDLGAEERTVFRRHSLRLPPGGPGRPAGGGGSESETPQDALRHLARHDTGQRSRRPRYLSVEPGQRRRTRHEGHLSGMTRRNGRPERGERPNPV